MGSPAFFEFVTAYSSEIFDAGIAISMVAVLPLISTFLLLAWLRLALAPAAFEDLFRPVVFLVLRLGSAGVAVLSSAVLLDDAVAAFAMGALFLLTSNRPNGVRRYLRSKYGFDIGSRV
jgi:hypothetical protein